LLYSGTSTANHPTYSELVRDRLYEALDDYDDLDFETVVPGDVWKEEIKNIIEQVQKDLIDDIRDGNLPIMNDDF